MKLEVLIGMIASGKSTYARRRADAGALVVSHDDLTEMLHARYRYEGRLRDTYRGMMKDLAIWAAAAGRDVVIDRTHLTRESRAFWVAVGRGDLDGTCGEVVAVVFPTLPPEDHARRRFKADPRGRSLKEWCGVALHHLGQAAAEPLDWEAEGFHRREDVRELVAK